MIRLCAFADEAGSSLQAQIDALRRNGIGLLEIRTVDSVNIGDMTLERAEEVAKKFSAKAYLSYEEMIDNENLDAIHICLPHNLHCHLSV